MHKKLTRQELDENIAVFVPSSPEQSGNDYPKGYSHGYVSDSDGWPVDGLLVNFKYSDTYFLQMLYDRTSSNPSLYYRRWRSDSSTEWTEFTEVSKQEKLDEHKADETPHETTDTVTNQKYKYGLAVKDGVWGIEKLEVSE